MYKNIITAISYLPEELINEEIAKAGIEEGDIKLLQILPVRYLTDDTVIHIIEKDQGVGGFNLKDIPSTTHTQTICELAVKRKHENFKEVPFEKRSEEMLNTILVSTPKNMHLLPLVPKEIWNNNSIYNGIYSCCAPKSNRYAAYHTKNDNLQLIQIFLAMVPNKFKTFAFYMGLFHLDRLSVKDISCIVPKKFKQGKFYQLLALYDFKLIPEYKYSYAVFTTALEPEAKSPFCDIITKETKPILFSFLDDTLADRIIIKEPDFYVSLPKEFQTEDRLLLAIEHVTAKYGYRNDDIISSDKLFPLTPKVCIAYIKKDIGYPIFPKEVWDEKFISFCMEYGHSFKWFEQIPMEWQTAEMVQKAILTNTYFVQYADPKLIREESAIKIHREDLESYRSDRFKSKFIPPVFYNDFHDYTGLPIDFFGGKVSLLELKEKKENFTYCELKHGFIGFYKGDSMYNPPTYLIMTLRTPQSMKPIVVFDLLIGTYHKTWLEKMVADNASQFFKPTVSKALKDFQINNYYGLEEIETVQEVKIYANLFMQTRICFTAKIQGEIYFKDSKDDIINMILQK